ncbi:cytochrome c oxidase subunit II [Paludisphaera mucosa]|uniref:Cytochrome c oxidase subunit 2 n=1 Tax=Paludisphaera mucosa TaxID=3030827 RepID=A0ABT6FKZ3_9BACT|nr:cytochrome c oxidase subunit II [Paludisphaera mucosa]MDG3008184.1 cytochrome c oxidase subunit II [Paludisphaera mucosa]
MWDFPLFPDQASTNAPKLDALMLFELGVLVFFTMAILLFVLAFCVRYRRGNAADRSHPPTHSKAMEAVWIVIPAILSVVMYAWSTRLFFDLYEAPADATQIDVVGKQWMWYVQHSQGRSETNELHVPLGRPMKLNMTSQDVLHSFYIPAFRIKQDVLPGRYTSLWFEPTKVGVYNLFCAEYCGTNHSLMIGKVHVMEPADYEAWLSEKGVGPSQAEEGGRLFVQHHCAGCHRGSQTVQAPRLEGVYGKPVPIQDGKDVHFVTADDRYIRDSILLPKDQVVAGYEPIMPSFKDQISETDLLKIIAYIKSIANGETSQ